MTPSQIEAMDIKRKPINVINKKLIKSRNMETPHVKIDNFENAVKNTKLLEVI